MAFGLRLRSITDSGNGVWPFDRRCAWIAVVVTAVGMVPTTVTRAIAVTVASVPGSRLAGRENMGCLAGLPKRRIRFLPCTSKPPPSIRFRPVTISSKSQKSTRLVGAPVEDSPRLNHIYPIERFGPLAPKRCFPQLVSAINPERRGILSHVVALDPDCDMTKSKRCSAIAFGSRTK